MPTQTPAHGRQNTRDAVKLLVWIRAAGHCELCGRDLTQDPRLREARRWGEVAHILPAGAAGPRATADYTSASAVDLTNDPANLLLACTVCHTLIDADPTLHPQQLLAELHTAQIARIALTASQPDARQAVGLVFLSQHFDTRNDISERELVPAMLADGLVPVRHPERVVLPAPSSTGRDAAYWRSVADVIDVQVTAALRRGASSRGDPPILAVAGLADIPALIALGRRFGDRSDRRLYSYSRDTGLAWPGPSEPAPAFEFTLPAPGKGAIALVLSLSAAIPNSDVIAALPGARIATFTVPHPSVALVRNRATIHAFRNAIQAALSQLEADGPEPLHVFAAIPAALAIEYGALLSMHHRHPQVIYDRENRHFTQSMRLE